MEYVTGGSLQKVLSILGPLGEDGGRFFMGQMCEALGYMHEMGVAHRDLKPDNVLLDNHCNIKLGDFGFVSKNPVEKLKTVLGTKGFLPPEFLSKQLE